MLVPLRVELNHRATENAGDTAGMDCKSCKASSTLLQSFIIRSCCLGTTAAQDVMGCYGMGYNIAVFNRGIKPGYSYSSV